MVHFAKETFPTVASYAGYSGICATIVPAQVVSHLGPHQTQLLNHGVAISCFIHESKAFRVHLRTILGL